jgi:Heterokaryon incompatibility protein (HET)
MDLIYARAQLTIVAVAGQDPHYGLPGVRGTRRSRQPQLRVGNHFLVSTLPTPKYAIRKSKWATRGWTYQEEILSKRRLFFTDEQVFYECNGMHCMETLIQPLDKMHVESRASFRENTPGHANHDKTPGTNPEAITAYISEFSRRDLKFPEDALNAMYGIFNAFSRGWRPVQQFLGVPILPVGSNLVNILGYEAKGRSTEERFRLGLSWYHSSPGPRTQQFPSWTWAGWATKIAGFFAESGDGSYFGWQGHVDIWVEEGDKSLVRFPNWDNLSAFLSQPRRQARFLHIEADTLTFPVVYLDNDTIQPLSWGYTSRVNVVQAGYYDQFEVRDGCFVYYKLHLDRDIDDIELTTLSSREKSQHSFVGIALDKSTYYSDSCTVLVVQEKGSYAERLGIFSSQMIHRYWHRYDSWYGYDPEPRFRTDLASSKTWARRTIRLG